MASDSSSRRSERLDSPSEPRHEGQLTGYVSQLDRFSGPPAHRQQRTLPDHPSNFSFPTLNLDGSLSDISSPPVPRYPPTPPAALSSLGAKAKMNSKDNVSESEGSLADEQYDMIDDLSEISADDHDTASIASNPAEGVLTPEDGASDAEVEESTLLLDDDQIHTPPSTAQSFIDLPATESSPVSDPPELLRVRSTKAENDLIDSYMSDDLETPRQSTIPIAFPQESRRTHLNQIRLEQQKSEDINHILFFSNMQAPRSVVDLICTKVASSMRFPDANALSVHRMVRLPPTPSGISLPSATVVYGQDSVSASIQHCIGAELRSANSFKLRILDSDGGHSSFFTIGRDAKIDLPKPDIAIFYLDADAENMAWLSAASFAIKALKTPVLIVHDPAFNIASPSPPIRSLVRKGKSVDTRALISFDEFTEWNESQLTDFVWGLLNDNVTISTSVKRPRSVLVRVLQKFLLLVVIMALPSLPFWAFLGFKFPDPPTKLEIRREGLIEALSLATGSSNVTNAFDIDHLLYTTPGSCSPTECKPHYHGMAPNHVVVSLPAQPRFPEVTTTRVMKADGRSIAFNQTQLIEGVYMFTFDPDEAYGVVIVNMLTRKPYLNVTAPHNYGSRILQRKTYEKASTDVGKAVGKDVAIMRNAAKNFIDKLNTELGAGAWATKNVTTQLAIYVARDLQVFGNAAVTFLDKAAKASNRTASALSKDFTLVRQDVARFTKDLSTMVNWKVAQAKNHSKALIRNPLAVSRTRLHGFKRAFERNKEAAKLSMKKEFQKVQKGVRKNVQKPRASPENAKAMSALPDAETPVVEPNVIAVLQAKRDIRKKTRQLEAVSQSIRKRQGKNGKKLTKGDLRRLKKEARQHEKALKRMKADVERNAHVV